MPSTLSRAKDARAEQLHKQEETEWKREILVEADSAHRPGQNKDRSVADDRQSARSRKQSRRPRRPARTRRNLASYDRARSTCSAAAIGPAASCPMQPARPTSTL